MIDGNDAVTITTEYLAPIGVMPVVVIERVEDAVPICRALKEGGVKAIEITLRTPAALDALRAVKDSGEDILLGVGTVTNSKNLKDAARIGVDFAVSPGLTPALIKSAQDLDVKLLPGVASPSEVMVGMELGLSCFKLYPATAVGGLALLKSIAGPLPQACFCPTGGLTIDNFRDYLALENVACVGGSWLVPKDAVNAKKWQVIKDIAIATVAKLAQ
jgi:2-dehydro-3-deoxyphosphogluconate aldolase/(4S)-4-hydroxy-2-oxoglutarate aldolase